ncbi:MAG TPA: Maf family protein [Methylomusa anaerophila]|uniref:dTTP/UTP pyrophosphatase n=1 Tax=Methylomusa anaerophila TaxID=1930071 RepID=A0A348AFA8_9FIRM|nr:Maf family protein [Methylomusa anaerophila]BBB89756.1 Maf-like protein YhdE [Methylomusa anaerophila]HML89198.1 Maf family protein [Methylomusa anaerophila]
MKIILASASPRRYELLLQIGCQFEVIASQVEEDNQKKLPPAQLAVFHARDKALAVAGQKLVADDDIVIGADTIVVHKGKIFGKPKDKEDAINMLTELSGQEHHVITGVSVIKGRRIWTDFAVTQVHLKQLCCHEIESYIATGEPMDKAGAYAIQGKGALLVESISGCYSNVVGLPLVTLARLMEKAGVRFL